MLPASRSLALGLPCRQYRRSRAQRRGNGQVIDKTPDDALKDRFLNRSDEAKISVATTERPWSFDSAGRAFKLAIEAKRIDLAFLFDRIRPAGTSSRFGLRGAVWAREQRLDAAERADAAPDGERDPSNT